MNTTTIAIVALVAVGAFVAWRALGAVAVAAADKPPEVVAATLPQPMQNPPRWINGAWVA